MDRAKEKWADHSIRSTVKFGDEDASDDDHDEGAGDSAEVDVYHDDDNDNDGYH